MELREPMFRAEVATAIIASKRNVLFLFAVIAFHHLDPDLGIEMDGSI
jgi:hypothetical protein